MNSGFSPLLGNHFCGPALSRTAEGMGSPRMEMTLRRSRFPAASGLGLCRLTVQCSFVSALPSPINQLLLTHISRTVTIDLNILVLLGAGRGWSQTWPPQLSPHPKPPPPALESGLRRFTELQHPCALLARCAATHNQLFLCPAGGLPLS